MKIMLLAVSALLGLAACATPPSYTGGGARAPQGRQADGEYIALVEAHARRRGVGVIWVHKPTREAVARRD